VLHDEISLRGGEKLEDKIYKYLSYGGGINSIAMMILLHHQNAEFESVFVDHGGDYPETYEYVEMLQRHFPITILKTVDDEKLGISLTDYCHKYRIMPSRSPRWCTAKFKIKPMYRYFKRPCIVYIGFDYGERHRAKPSEDFDVYNENPLIERKIDRKGCEKIILDKGLPLPRKSGCFYCPYQKPSEFIHLRDDYPNLWCKTKRIEDEFLERRKEKGKKPFYLRDAPLDSLVKEKQTDFFGWRKPCQCGQ